MNRIVDRAGPVAALFFIVLSISTGASFASAQALNSVPWPELGDRVIQLGVLQDIDSLGIAACPAEITGIQIQPDRIVLQWIENTFYKWQEYDLTDGRMCILMAVPRAARLTIDQMQILLSASRIWQLQAPSRAEASLAPVDIADPSLQFPPIQRRPIDPSSVDHENDSAGHQGVSAPPHSGVDIMPPTGAHWDSAELAPESVIGSDDRSPVPDTEIYPYNTIGYVTFNQAGWGYRASAFLVSPFSALTNGHVVYDQYSNTWSTDMTVYPGQYESGARIFRPYGSTSAYQLMTSAGYSAGSGDPQYDYAAIQFLTPFSGINTYMPVVFTGFDIDNTTTVLALAGYPADAQGQATQDQWSAENMSSSQTTATVARYFMDSSGGNSGGPVWMQSGGNRYVVAIHCCGWGNPNPNGGPLMGAHNQTLIESWMSWTPQPPAATLISPGEGISTASPTFTWKAVSQASRYYLWVDDTSSGGGGKIRTWLTSSEAGCADGQETCAVTPTTVLASGSAVWWIQTWNEFGEGPWSDGKVFSVSTGGPPGASILTSPSGTINDSTPTYRWQAVGDSTWYNLWVDDSTSGGASRIQTWYTAAEAGCAWGRSACSVTPATTLAAGSSIWWIQTWNEAGEGPWSEPMTFFVDPGPPPGPATLLKPNGTISNNSPTYRWRAVSDSTWYQLWVDDSTSGGSGKIQTWYTAAETGCGSDRAICTITPAVPLANGDATWWIQTWNESGDGPWSKAMGFTVRSEQ